MRRPTQRGFTLLEMMVTLAIMAILAALAGYTMQGAIAHANAVSLSDRMYNIIAEAHSLALVKNAQVIVVVDMDDTDTSSSHGGVYEILDPDEQFTSSKMANWSTGYTVSSGVDPIAANSSIFTTPTRAQMLNQVRFTDPGIAGRVKAPLASEIDTYAAQAEGVAGSPWPVPSSTAVSGTYSGTGCSFCKAGLGYVLVGRDGAVSLSDPDDLTTVQPLGSKGYLMLSNPETNKVDRALFIATPTGLVDTHGAT